MSNFTQGPWVVVDEDETSIRINGAQGEWVADCCDGHYDDEGEFHRTTESLPNAHLIAAAPELFEALWKIMKWWADTPPNSSSTNDDMPANLFDAAHYALAKAQGEAP